MGCSTYSVFIARPPSGVPSLVRVHGWSGPVPPLSDMGQTGLTGQPSRPQDAEKDLQTVQAGLEELQITVGGNRKR